MRTRDELTPLGHKLASPARERLAPPSHVPNDFGWDDDSDTQVVTPDMLAPAWDDDAWTEPSAASRRQPAAASRAPLPRTAAGSGVRESVARQLARPAADSGAGGAASPAPGKAPARASAVIEEDDPVDELRERLIGTLERARKAEGRVAIAEQRTQAAEQRAQAAGQRAQQIEEAHEQEGVHTRALLEELRGRLAALQDRARVTEAQALELERRAEEAEQRAGDAEQRAYEAENQAAESEQESIDALRQMADQLADAHDQNQVREEQLFEADARRERAAREAREARAALQHSETTAARALKAAALRARVGLCGFLLVVAALAAGTYYLVHLPAQHELAVMESGQRFAGEQHARELADLRATHEQQQRILTSARIDLERQLVEARAAATEPPPAARVRDVLEAEALAPTATPRRARRVSARRARSSAISMGERWRGGHEP